MVEHNIEHGYARSARQQEAWQVYAEVADLVVTGQRGDTLRGELLELTSKPLPRSTTLMSP
jgi:hypothetical protein